MVTKTGTCFVLLTAKCSENGFVQSACDTDDYSCLPWSYRCDHEHDCEDFSDEAGCFCDATEFDCTNGECIDLMDACNGIPDCSDGSDEAYESCGKQYKKESVPTVHGGPGGAKLSKTLL